MVRPSMTWQYRQNMWIYMYQLTGAMCNTCDLLWAQVCAGIHTHTHTLHWLSIAPDLVHQIKLTCLVERPNHCSPWWLPVPTFSPEEFFHHSLEAVLIRAMLMLEINPIILIKELFSQCPPALHSFHNWQHILQCEGRGCKERETAL